MNTKSQALWTAFLVLLLTGVPTQASSQTPVGGEFAVNSYTTYSQLFPSVAMDADGDFMVVWESHGQDGSSSGVLGHRFASDGTSGGEFVVNSYTTGWQGFATVAMDDSGSSVVVWSGYGHGGSPGLFGQRFASDGNPLGSEFAITSYTTTVWNPSVAADADGDFVVVWISDGQDGNYLGIFGQRLASDGTPSGGEFAVNSYTTNFQWTPSVAMDADGDFVVVWASLFQDGSESSVFGQRYSSDGTPLSGEFQVNSYSRSNQYGPSVGMDADGDFVVVWTSDRQYGRFPGVFGQRFASDGSRLGSEFAVGSYFWRVGPSVAVDDDGDFLVVWLGLDRSFYRVVGQSFASDGSPRANEFAVSAYATSAPTMLSVGMDADGDFVVVWASDGQDGSSWGVFGQRFRADPAIGDRVWSDANVNGIQDAGETGIPRVTVLLYDYLGTFIDGDTTDSDGLFRFPVITSGDYYAELLVPDGYVLTAANQGVDDLKDSDADPTSGRTPVARLGNGLLEIGWDAGLAPDDLVTLGVNQHDFQTGDDLEVSVLVNNEGSATLADFYFGVLLPNGQTLVYARDLAMNFGIGTLGDVSTLMPMVAGVDLSTPFVARGPRFFDFGWSGDEVEGTYRLFLAAVLPGGFADGAADAGDILGLSSATITFTR